MFNLKFCATRAKKDREQKSVCCINSNALETRAANLFHERRAFLKILRKLFLATCKHGRSVCLNLDAV